MTSTEHITRARSTYEAIAAAMGGRQRVLAVDDDSNDLLIFQRGMRDMPVDVDVAHSVHEAIGMLEQRGYYIVFIDLAMPVEGGSVLVQWMAERKDEHGQPVLMRPVIHTGSTKSDELEKALKFGPVVLMSKDFTAEHFLRLLYLVNLPQPIEQYAVVA